MGESRDGRGKGREGKKEEGGWKKKKGVRNRDSPGLPTGSWRLEEKGRTESYDKTDAQVHVYKK